MIDDTKTDDKTKDLAVEMMGASVYLFNEKGNLPLNICLHSAEHGLCWIFFDRMNDSKDKSNIAALTLLLCEKIGDVELLSFASESWYLNISQEEHPKFWKKHNGDHNKIRIELLNGSRDIAGCPNKQEGICFQFDDGINKNLVLNADIIRYNDQAKAKVLPIDKSQLMENKTPVDFAVTFNSLLTKSKILSAVHQKALTIFPEKEYAEVAEAVLTRYHYECDWKRMQFKARQIARRFKGGNREHTIH